MLPELTTAEVENRNLLLEPLTLRRRALNQVDTWDGSTYRRVLLLADTPVAVAVTQEGVADA
jgi:hypothetical protein